MLVSLLHVASSAVAKNASQCVERGGIRLLTQEPGDRKHGGGRVCCKPFAEVRCPQSAGEEQTAMWRL
ncbi:hypothetical protein COCON_G00088790 [Conger conger]|uniref:Uncharacterized protein n=1 Tax=Conger conger TaxID=82655 RepID=A0A9Q1DKN3_CONCO|nr:hypothetical protein COCON_G00088790 [Conger conger]